MTRNSDAGTPCPAALWARGGPKPTCISCQQAELLKGRQTLGSATGQAATPAAVQRGQLPLPPPVLGLPVLGSTHRMTHCHIACPKCMLAIDAIAL
jgi:hypothetical protein